MSSLNFVFVLKFKENIYDIRHLFQIRKPNSKICHKFLEFIINTMMQTQIKGFIKNYDLKTFLESSFPFILREGGL